HGPLQPERVGSHRSVTRQVHRDDPEPVAEADLLRPPHRAALSRGVNEDDRWSVRGAHDLVGVGEWGAGRDGRIGLGDAVRPRPTYFGAMRAGVIIVPLDLRMAPDAIERIAQRAEAHRFVVGTGRDAPDPRDAGIDSLPRSTVEELAAEPDAAFPADWQAQVQ